MNRTVTVLALVGGMVVGATLLRDAIPNSQAQIAAPTSQPTQATPAAPATSAPSSAFNERGALLQNEQNSISVINQNQDGVVFVTVTSTPQQPSLGSSGQDPFSQFFGQGQGGDLQPQPQTGSGSGFLVNDAGYILTNYHVVEDASEITIKLHSDKKEYKARVIGTAPDYDLALIKSDTLPKSAIKPMKLGNSDTIQAGRKVIAMGAPFGLDFTATEGIVSAVGREIPTGQRGVPQTAIQTDAAINPGNSGGPLVNSAGEVIGINTQIFTRGVGQSAGVGFAIPINTAKNLLPRLQAGGQISTPTLGIAIGDLSGLTTAQRRQLGTNIPESGIVVSSVTAGSPASSANLQVGDVILSIDGQSVTERDDLRKYLFAKNFGDTVRLQIRRGGTDQTVSVTLRQFGTNTAR